jgi:four helix bundle protein
MAQTHQLLSFDDWAKSAGAGVSRDPLWSVQSYRIALYAVECLTFDRRSNSRFAAAPAVDQLTRALGSIAAHIAEGYSRGSIADRRQFYGYALGSTREAIAWYNTLHIELGPVVEDRQALLIQIRRLLVTTVRNSRPEDATAILSDRQRKK